MKTLKNKSMFKKKILGVPLFLIGLLAISGVFAAAFVVAALGISFGVTESINARYKIVNPGTDCSRISIASAIPSPGIRFANVLPGDEKRICFRVTSTNSESVDVSLILSSEWGTSPVIGSSTVVNPGATDSSGQTYGYVDYSIAGNVDPAETFTGSISIGRE